MIARHMVTAAALALVAAQASSQAPQGTTDWSRAEPVTVELSNFKFSPSAIQLKQGRAYDLRLANMASGGHDFSAGEFFAAARIMDADRAKITEGRVAVAAGKSVDIHLVAPAPGTYKLRCTHFMHSSFGMTGEIVVQ
ncbi:cupredoxin domain-containing protein [Novosphingobium sp. BL-8H]|uniref:cupredoxin domain-containing protein n=1 Tax=Novosphingobium sp. BL-8H TaxID=3127640 RepID=UPI003756D01B